MEAPEWRLPGASAHAPPRPRSRERRLKEKTGRARPRWPSAHEERRRGHPSEAWLLVGESELKQKRFAPAAKAFETVRALNDVDAGVRYRALAGLGLTREEQQDWKAALAAYEAVVNRSPDATLRDWARDRATAMKSRLAKPNGAPKPAPKKEGKS